MVSRNLPLESIGKVAADCAAAPLCVMVPDFMDSEVIARWRNKLGLTQEQLANFLGVSTSTVQSWELAARLPSPSSIERLEREYVLRATQEKRRLQMHRRKAA